MLTGLDAGAALEASPELEPLEDAGLAIDDAEGETTCADTDTVVTDGCGLHADKASATTVIARANRGLLPIVFHLSYCKFATNNIHPILANMLAARLPLIFAALVPPAGTSYDLLRS